MIFLIEGSPGKEEASQRHTECEVINYFLIQIQSHSNNLTVTVTVVQSHLEPPDQKLQLFPAEGCYQL